MSSFAGVHSVAYVTVPNDEVAKRLARGLVENKLAACVNIIPQLTSIYEWEGKIQEEPELLLMIKTRTEKVDALTKYVKGNHPYSVCEVISLPVMHISFYEHIWMFLTQKNTIHLHSIGEERDTKWKQ
ncbi:hypothetical protein P5V15_009681 [Pogonomyrmex californicus]